MPRQTKAEKLIDLRVGAAYRRTCCGVQINMLDITKVFAVGKKAIIAGVDNVELDRVVKTFVDTIRLN